MARLLLSFLALVTGVYATTLTATLKPATVNLGKSATLTLVCEGGIATTVEQTAAAGNLALSFVGSTKSIDIVGGVTRVDGQQHTLTGLIFTERLLRSADPGDNP